MESSIIYRTARGNGKTKEVLNEVIARCIDLSFEGQSFAITTFPEKKPEEEITSEKLLKELRFKRIIQIFKDYAEIELTHALLGGVCCQTDIASVSSVRSKVNSRDIPLPVHLL